MPRTRHRCYQCGRPREVAGHISRKGLCEDCALENLRVNTLVVTGKMERAHAEWVQRWLEGCGHYGRGITSHPPDA